MKGFKMLITLSLFAVALFWGTPAIAQSTCDPSDLDNTGNCAPSGPHYNLNIIGVEKAKTADMTGSNRHTIFVALGKTGGVTSKIYLTPAEDFKVCDGNAFDEAYNCDGIQIRAQGAVFALPCNTNLDREPIRMGTLYSVSLRSRRPAACL
jgi:hypothetical protein